MFCAFPPKLTGTKKLASSQEHKLEQWMFVGMREIVAFQQLADVPHDFLLIEITINPAM